MVGLSQNLEKELLSEAIRNTHANTEGELVTDDDHPYQGEKWGRGSGP